jgi:MOSC domain-containing protein YiiM
MAFAPDSPFGKLLAGPMRPGRVAWIGLRPARRAAMLTPESASLIAGQGIAGDHYQTTHDGLRQVTLIAVEDVAAIAAFLGVADIAPHLLRRNLVTSGINLAALRKQRFRISDVLLEGSGDCAPCSLMEQALGPGGYNAVRGHGGITARVVAGGEIRVGDVVERIP